MCPRDPQSCTGGSLVLLGGLTMPGRSAGEGSDKTALWTSRLEARRRVNHPVKSPPSQKTNLMRRALSQV